MDLRIFMEGVALIETIHQATKGMNAVAFTKPQLKLYKMLLDDIPEELFIQGINTMLRERPYTSLPSPAEIRKFCLGTREEDLNIRIAQAKNKLVGALDSVGTYATVVFDDPIIHLIIRDLGGWIKLGKMDRDDYEKFLTFEFPKLYKGYATRKNTDIPIMLKGISEDKTINYIGNKEKAQKWVLSYTEKMESLENKNTPNLMGINVNKMILEMRDEKIA